MMERLILSSLEKTWVLDLDGTIVKHNGYKNGEDELLEGVHEFFLRIGPSDRVIILTARSAKEREATISFLKKNDIRFDDILFDIPVGERILVNDKKPSGMITAHAINKIRDERLDISIIIDENM